MNFDLQTATALLIRTPATMKALLRGLPPSLTQTNEGKDTWDPRTVVAHLIHTDRINWVPRAKWLLEFGESRVFPPPANNNPREDPLEHLLDEFTDVRAEKLAELHALHLTGQDLARRGLHPKFGSVTLSQLLATWAAHDLTHLHQISRILAHQFKESVGPWTEFLGVMHCNGHSSF